MGEVNVISLIADKKHYDNCLWHNGLVAFINVDSFRLIKKHVLIVNGTVDCCLKAKRNFTDSSSRVWRKEDIIAVVSENDDFFYKMSDHIKDDKHLREIISDRDSDYCLIINSKNRIEYHVEQKGGITDTRVLNFDYISEAIDHCLSIIRASPTFNSKKIMDRAKMNIKIAFCYLISNMKKSFENEIIDVREFKHDYNLLIDHDLLALKLYELAITNRYYQQSYSIFYEYDKPFLNDISLLGKDTLVDYCNKRILLEQHRINELISLAKKQAKECSIKL